MSQGVFLNAGSCEIVFKPSLVSVSSNPMNAKPGAFVNLPVQPCINHTSTDTVSKSKKTSGCQQCIGVVQLAVENYFAVPKGFLFFYTYQVTLLSLKKRLQNICSSDFPNSDCISSKKIPSVCR